MSLLLEAAELSRSTFYYQNHVLAHPDQDEAALCERIRAIYDQSQGRYGYRTVTLELANQGHRTNHKRVQRLMGEMGLKSRVRVKRYRSFKGPPMLWLAMSSIASFTPSGPTRSG